MKRLAPTILLLILLILVSGFGYYYTEVKQEEELEHIEKQHKLARMRYAEVEALLVEESASADQADQTLRKWQARYKYVPEVMKTPDIVQYIESLTERGFEHLGISLSGVTNTADLSYYTFDVRGTAYYDDVYDLVWHLENNREFYRIRNLKLQHTNVFDGDSGKRRRDMVEFSFSMDAYFAGVEGLSGSEEELLDVPDVLLPIHEPPHNSFYPLVRTRTSGGGGGGGGAGSNLLDVRKAKLISLTSERALFRDDRGLHVVQIGDEVRYGKIVRLDPIRMAIRAELTINGATEQVEVRLGSDRDQAEQAKGPSTLVPATDDWDRQR